MLPNSIVGLIISILVIVGVGAILYVLGGKKTGNSNSTLAFYAFLVILAVIHPIATGISVAISLYLLITGKQTEKLAAGGFILVAIIAYLVSHAFLIFHL